MTNHVTLLAAPRPVTCPSCSTQISWRYVAPEFPCPVCGAGLCLRRRYFIVLYYISLISAATVAYLAGLRGALWLSAVALAALPLHFLITLINLRLFPPEVELSGAFQAILYPGEEEDALRPPDPVVLFAPKQPPPAATDSVADAPVIFTSRAERLGFEGVVAIGMLVFAIVSGVYLIAEPLVYEIVPDFRATKHGGRGFPVAVHIGTQSLRVTNGSPEPWHCQTVLGSRGSYHGAVSLAPGATGEILYRDFKRDPRLIQTDKDIWRVARQYIEIECTDPTGLTHYAIF